MAANDGKTIVVPNDIFFSQVVESLNEGRNVTFTVKGWSMYPFFRDGKDRVCVRKFDGNPLRTGEVILFRYRGNYILHRIYSVSAAAGRTERPSASPAAISYLTMGDGNVRGTESAVPATIAGVATGRITPSGKEWKCGSLSWRCCSALWRMLLPLRRWCLAVLRRLYR